MNHFDYGIINHILLRKHHPMTHMIIRDAQEACMHIGIRATRTRIHLRRFWTAAARHTIRSVLRGCQVCNKFNSFVFEYPKFTNFTKAQVQYYRPFHNAGVDFIKNWWLKDEAINSDSRMYIIIYIFVYM